MAVPAVHTVFMSKTNNTLSGFINNDGVVLSSEYLEGGAWSACIADIWFDEDRGTSATAAWMCWGESYAHGAW